MSNQLPPDIATSTKLHRLKRRPTDARTADPDAEMITTEAELKMIDAIVQYRSNRITLSQSKASKSVTKDMSLAPDGEPATVFPLAEYRRFPSRAIARIYYRIQSWKPQNIPYNRELLLALLFEPPFVQSPLLSTTSERAWTDYNPVSDIAHTSATLDFNRIVTGRLTVCGLSVYAEPVSDLMELLQDPPLDPDDSPTMAVCRVFTARHRMTDPDGCEEVWNSLYRECFLRTCSRSIFRRSHAPSYLTSRLTLGIPSSGSS